MNKQSTEFLKELVFDKKCVDRAIKNGKGQELEELEADYINIMHDISHVVQDELDILVPKENQFVLGQLIRFGVARWIEGKIVGLE